MPNLKTVEQPTFPADTLRDAGARLRAARDAVALAEQRIAAYDIGPDENAEHNAQERVRLADEALADALADDDPEAIAAARERRDEAIAAWNTARSRADDRRAALKGLQRRREAALAEQKAAQAAFDEAQAEWLKGELERAEMAYAKAAEQARDTYCRTRAVFWRLKLAMGDAGKGMVLSDTSLRLPALGKHSRQLCAHPEQHGAAFDATTGSAQLEAADAALSTELAALAGGEA